jgi:hypothetical protein
VASRSTYERRHWHNRALPIDKETGKRYHMQIY